MELNKDIVALECEFGKLVLDTDKENSKFDDERNINSNVDNRIVLLDLETSGFYSNCDILQIAAKCGEASFNVYINPTKKIFPRVTEINGLSECNGDLMYNGQKVSSVPLRIAVENLLEWLKTLGDRCYIVTHNMSFDGPRLYNAINSCSLSSSFSEVICGFIDTLQIIREHTQRKGKGTCTVTGLAEWLNVSITVSHNAQCDVIMLEEVLKKLEITDEMLIKKAKNYLDQTRKWDNDVDVRNVLGTLDPLRAAVGESIRKKLARASITFDHLLDAYNTCGSQGITDLLCENAVTIHQTSVLKITKYLETQLQLTH